MDGKIKELLTILKQENEIHDRLIECAQIMNKALKENDTNKIQQTSMKYDELTCNIESVEEKRLEICDSIGKKTKMKSRHLNLTSITEALPPEDTGPLGEVRQDLKKKITKLTKINTSNQVLLENALANIAKAVELIACEKKKYSGYKQYGKKDSDFIFRNIVNKVA
ncbi:MAG: hypothetical protein GF401_14395 [Chitinivibrionales bacterium]|nr:hypothetical protein [Chitinivibrionales bacterium]